jgi:hypothetical protein
MVLTLSYVPGVEGDHDERMVVAGDVGEAGMASQG